MKSAEALTAAGLPAGYSIERHLLFRAALEGVICLGPDRGGAPGDKPTFVMLGDWLQRAPVLPSDDGARRLGLEALAERYLAAYAPATLADFSAWSGLNMRDLRAGWDVATERLLEVDVAGRSARIPEPRMAELDKPLPDAPLVPALTHVRHVYPRP